MHNSDDVATLRAALLYWLEEICPHGAAAIRPYLDPPDARILSAEEVADLRESLRVHVRYAIYDASQDRLADTKLYTVHEVALEEAGVRTVATVIIRWGRTSNPQPH